MPADIVQERVDPHLLDTTTEKGLVKYNVNRTISDTSFIRTPLPSPSRFNIFVKPTVLRANFCWLPFRLPEEEFVGRNATGSSPKLQLMKTFSSLRFFCGAAPGFCWASGWLASSGGQVDAGLPSISCLRS